MLGTQGTCQLLPHTPPQQSHTHTHTHSCTLPWLTSHDTNDQPNYGYTHTTQSYSHAKRLHSQTSNLTVLSTKSQLYSQLKNFNAHTLKITALQLSVRHIKL